MLTLSVVRDEASFFRRICSDPVDVVGRIFTIIYIYIHYIYCIYFEAYIQDLRPRIQLCAARVYKDSAGPTELLLCQGGPVAGTREGGAFLQEWVPRTGGS